MHCVLCIILYPLYYILCIAFYPLYYMYFIMHCILCIVLLHNTLWIVCNAFWFMPCILCTVINAHNYNRGYILTLKLIAD